MYNNINFHCITSNETLKYTESTNTGLSSKEANQRLANYGLNELNNDNKISILKLFLSQFKDFMIIILIFAAFISFIVSIIEGNADIVDPIIILSIIIFNSIIGVVQEYKAERSLESLKKLSTPYSNVIRDNVIQIIPSSNLVVGDIILLEAGNFVPADARLLEASNLKIDESALTGESLPVEKNHAITLSESTPIAERKNMVYSSSIITYGRGKAIVTATGPNTEVGQIANLITNDSAPDTPLQKNLAKTSKILGIIALGICLIIFLVGILQKRPIFDMFMTSVSLAVASIPY